jgi:hypothetical protein
MIKTQTKHALYDRNGPCQKLCKCVPDNVIHVHREIGVLSRKCMNVNLSVHRGSVGGNETPFNVVCHFVPMVVEESALEDLMIRGFSILPTRTCLSYFEKIVLQFCVTYLYAVQLALHSPFYGASYSACIDRGLQSVKVSTCFCCIPLSLPFFKQLQTYMYLTSTI